MVVGLNFEIPYNYSRLKMDDSQVKISNIATLIFESVSLFSQVKYPGAPLLSWNFNFTFLFFPGKNLKRDFHR